MMMMMMMITSWHICLYLLLPDPVLHYIEEMGILFLRLKKVLNCNSHKEKRSWKVKREVLGLATGGHQIISFNWNSLSTLGRTKAISWLTVSTELKNPCFSYASLHSETKTKYSCALMGTISVSQGLSWMVADCRCSNIKEMVTCHFHSDLPPPSLPPPPMPCKRETT